MEPQSGSFKKPMPKISLPFAMNQENILIRAALQANGEP
jgi:hypothetical protein